jgi:hypothetical protein
MPVATFLFIKARIKISYETSGWYDGTRKLDQHNAQYRRSTLTFMSGLIDPREREISILSYLASYTNAAKDRCIACCLEFVRHGIVNSGRDFLAADPIAREISIPVNQCYFNATVEQVADGLKAVWAEEVASAGECFSNCIALCAVVDGYA